MEVTMKKNSVIINQFVEHATDEELAGYSNNKRALSVRKGDPVIDGQLQEYLDHAIAVQDVDQRISALRKVEEMLVDPNKRKNVGLFGCKRTMELFSLLLKDLPGIPGIVGRSFPGIMMQFEVTVRQSEAGKIGFQIRQAKQRIMESKMTNSEEE
jgi:hypothetical protein